MDLVLKLREIRRMRGLSQKDVARLSGVGEKTISSFETGHRIGSLKLNQLKKLLEVYGLTECDFFSGKIEKQIAPWELNEEEFAISGITDDLRALPKHTQKSMIAKFQLMLEAHSDAAPEVKERRTPYVRQEPDEWHAMASRN